MDASGVPLRIWTCSCGGLSRAAQRRSGWGHSLLGSREGSAFGLQGCGRETVTGPSLAIEAMDSGPQRVMIEARVCSAGAPGWALGMGGNVWQRAVATISKLARWGALSRDFFLSRFWGVSKVGFFQPSFLGLLVSLSLSL